MDDLDRPNRLPWVLLLIVAFAAPYVVNFDLYLIHVGITIAFNVALAASALVWAVAVAAIDAQAPARTVNDGVYSSGQAGGI